ncbi:MAG: hypothetical protein HYU58_05445 [Proteobacteria bacterium]|nr:hypothetical protein [Pseudomonadota bacterium]
MAEYNIPSLAVGSGHVARSDAEWGASKSGANRTVTYQLDIQSQAARSGLYDMTTQREVYLFLVDGSVFGREGHDEAAAEIGEIVFVLSVDADGKITQDQFRSVASPGTLAAPDLITLTAIVSGKDGTTDRASAKIGGSLEFAMERAERRRRQRGQSGDLSPDGDVAPLSADIIYELSVAVAGADTGLTDAASGKSIFLFGEGEQVIARIGDDAMAAAVGEIAFLISVDQAGNVLLDQRREITGSEAFISAALSQPDLVRLRARLGGSDGKREVAYANIAGSLRFGERGARAAISPGPASFSRNPFQSASADTAFRRDWRQAEKSQAPHTIM